MRTEDWRNATPQQINLYRDFLTRLPGVQTITPYHYEGAVGGMGSIGTYDAKALYYGLYFYSNYSTGTPVSPGATIILKDENNLTVRYMLNYSAIYDSTAAAAKVVVMPIELKDFICSAIGFTTYNYFVFHGYKMTIP